MKSKSKKLETWNRSFQNSFQPINQVVFIYLGATLRVTCSATRATTVRLRATGLTLDESLSLKMSATPNL